MEVFNIAGCVFCHKEKIITGFIYEDERVMAFMDMEPVNEGHVLLITKEHYPGVGEVPGDILVHLIIISKKIVLALKDIYKPDRYSIMQNGGDLMILDITKKKNIVATYKNIC